MCVCVYTHTQTHTHTDTHTHRHTHTQTDRQTDRQTHTHTHTHTHTCIYNIYNFSQTGDWRITKVAADMVGPGWLENCWRMRTYADVYCDVFRRMPTYAANRRLANYISCSGSGWTRMTWKIFPKSLVTWPIWQSFTSITMVLHLCATLVLYLCNLCTYLVQLVYNQLFDTGLPELTAFEMPIYPPYTYWLRVCSLSIRQEDSYSCIYVSWYYDLWNANLSTFLKCFEMPIYPPSCNANLCSFPRFVVQSLSSCCISPCPHSM